MYELKHMEWLEMKRGIIIDGVFTSMRVSCKGGREKQYWELLKNSQTITYRINTGRMHFQKITRKCFLQPIQILYKTCPVGLII